MSAAHAYTEDQLVEQPAIGLFAEHSKGDSGQLFTISPMFT
jgi:hypothetical protein